MIKRTFRTALAYTRNCLYAPSRFASTASLMHRPTQHFCQNKGLTVSDIPHQNLQVKVSSRTVGEQQVQMYKTKDSISIMDKVQGVKADNGELYVLSFRCTKCNTQSIRSFTKHAYHKGVVLVRCCGCQNIHLVADNLGWFQDDPVNIETMHQGKVQKVHDQVAIVNFLKKAFEEDVVKPVQEKTEEKAQPTESK